MSFDFIEDLDGYFCEKYANYDKMCVLDGYHMPKMQTTERREDGTDYSYTLPANTMRLALQENRAQLLAKLKEGFWDESFSFSFRPASFSEKFRMFIGKPCFKKLLPVVLNRKHMTVDQAGALVNVDEVTWQKILKGTYLPTKNLLFSLALAARLSFEDTEELMNICGFTFDYATVKDTVISYLLTKSIGNAEMIRAALDEYKVGNLFIKEL